MFGVALGLMVFCKTCFVLPISNDTIPSKSHLVLPEINIKGNAVVAKRRGDTLIYSADQYKRPDAIRLEQLLNNLPGFQVDLNGRISFNGKYIQKLMLDGDDLTAENYQLISRNLRSLLIDSIQVVEKYNENRLMKHLNESNGIAINLVLKPSYYGKPTVNLISAYTPKNSGELQSELIQLNKKMKQLILFNANNIGTYPLQNQMLEEPIEPTNQEVLFYSWPLVLQNKFVGGLSSRYINQNGDLGLAYATTIKANRFNQLRFNLRKSYQSMDNSLEQNQFFSYGDDLAILMYSLNNQKRKNNSTYGIIDWENDKGGSRNTKIHFKFYHDISKLSSTELRELIKLNKIVTHSILSAKGMAVSINQTWKAKPNHVWILESDLEASNNNYQIDIYRSDFMNGDSLSHKLNQGVHHSGMNARTGIGYFMKLKQNNFKFWFRSSLSKIHSTQYLEKLQFTVMKNFLSTHFVKALGKKFNLEMQAMLGVVDYRIKSNKGFQLMYHIDQTIVWKKKPTQQFSFNYGILQQSADVRKFFVGEVYLNGNTLIKGPKDLSFPLSIYAQLNFSAMNLYRGLTFSGQLLTKRVIRDYFMSVELDPFYTKLIELQNGIQVTQSLNFHFEKIIHSVRIKYRIQTNLMQSKSLSQFNTKQFYAINQFYRIGNILSTNWRKGYNLQFDYHYIRSKFNEMNLRKTLWGSRYEYKATFQFQVNDQINANFSLLRYSGKGILSLTLLDCSINWVLNARYRFYLQGFNLLNKKWFVEQFIQTNSISINKQQLIGRRVSLGFDLPL
jgi:hypothetical protein